MSEDDNILPFPEGPQPEDESLVPVLEALLYASGEPVEASVFAQVLDVGATEVRRSLRLLGRQLAAREGGLELIEVGTGWQLRTRPEHARAVLALRGAKPQRLSKAALEVLAIVAYQQPVIRSEVDALRGVDSGAVLKGLLDRGVVRVVGRRDMPGRPLEYGTSRAFLEIFGLKSVDQLPTLQERAELAPHDE